MNSEQHRIAAENARLIEELQGMHDGTKPRGGAVDFVRGLWLLSPFGEWTMPRQTRVFRRALEIMRQRDADEIHERENTERYLPIEPH